MVGNFSWSPSLQPVSFSNSTGSSATSSRIPPLHDNIISLETFTLAWRVHELRSTFINSESLQWWTSLITTVHYSWRLILSIDMWLDTCDILLMKKEKLCWNQKIAWRRHVLTCKLTWMSNGKLFETMVYIVYTRWRCYYVVCSIKRDYWNL